MLKSVFILSLRFILNSDIENLFYYSMPFLIEIIKSRKRVYSKQILIHFTYFIIGLLNLNANLGRIHLDNYGSINI